MPNHYHYEYLYIRIHTLVTTTNIKIIFATLASARTHAERKKRWFEFTKFMFMALRNDSIEWLLNAWAM